MLFLSYFNFKYTTLETFKSGKTSSEEEKKNVIIISVYKVKELLYDILFSKTPSSG